MRYYFLLFVLLAGTVNGQDVLRTRTGQLFTGKVLEMNPIELKFQLNGIDTIFTLTDVFAVKHQVGFYDKVSANGFVNRRFQPWRRVEKWEFVPRPYRSNYFHIGVGNLFFGEISMGYERLLDGGKIGIKVPVKFQTIFYEAERNLIESYGLDLLLYPGRQGTFRFYTGLGLRVGTAQFKYTEKENVGGILNYGYNSYSTKYYESSFRAIMLNTGVMFRPFRWLGFNAFFGLGQARYKGSNDSSVPEQYHGVRRELFPDVQLNLTIGI